MAKVDQASLAQGLQDFHIPNGPPTTAKTRDTKGRPNLLLRIVPVQVSSACEGQLLAGA